MAGEELQFIRLKDDFYRDGFYKALTGLAVIFIAIALLISVFIYLIITKPEPVRFAADNEWRIVAPVPIDRPYLPIPDLLQWVSEALPAVFEYDFVNYASELRNNTKYFTDKGWKIFLDQLNIYVNANTVQNAKQFVSASPSGAPIITRQGILPGGIYGWWIEMPINININSANTVSTLSLMIQALVVRVSTLNNLSGVAIDNIVVSKGVGEGRANA